MCVCMYFIKSVLIFSPLSISSSFWHSIRKCTNRFKKNDFVQLLFWLSGLMFVDSILFKKISLHIHVLALRYNFHLWFRRLSFASVFLSRLFAQFASPFCLVFSTSLLFEENRIFSSLSLIFRITLEYLIRNVHFSIFRLRSCFWIPFKERYIIDHQIEVTARYKKFHRNA